MNTVIFSCENICKSYDGQLLLQDVSLEIGQNEIVSLLGKSGVGKSTLFNILSGVMRPEAGQVLLEGQDITGKPGHIGYMQQRDLLFEYKTVLKNAALPLVIQGEKKNAAYEKAASHFARFGLEGCEHKYPCQLSGGMRQRAALLRTYLTGHKAALLDEPFSALDALTKRKLQDWYTDIHKSIGMTTLFITHDVDEAVRISDRILIMEGPPSVIGADITVPRHGASPQDFELTREFLEIKQEVYSLCT